jgi:hypothetical protein
LGYFYIKGPSMNKDEALRLALEALEDTVNGCICRNCINQVETITAIKAALEAKDEPVAWRTYTGRGYYIIDKTLEEAERNWPDKPHTPLYTTPPQRTWIGLTDKDWNRSKHTEDFEKGVDWAEEMLKGKNT